ncbi:CGNR zinc finger domain-containing protein [Paraburkholderia megapolitana]|uniref:CGNR zinc finger domain-containing protein n=1 Tax=Paraburkholderia megapolitana TaxID=420953 RepID=UPI0038B6E8E9
MNSPRPPDVLIEPMLIADHVALDLLNTVAQVDGAPRDFLQSDADVLRWLERMRLPANAPAFASHAPHALLDATRALRETVRTLVAQRKAGENVDVAALNAFLARGRYAVQVVADEGSWRVERRTEQRCVEHLLMPLAEAAAELLTNGEFDLVRKCEQPDCTRCFYDRTKSHRRRWCSMATCGNRHKVANYRKRQQG